ncbi:MAG: LPS export ABC transporter periplasmic protein LptC [Flavobacteriales bacterium]|jgi:LPS export ABC transporter protein LptC
MTAIKGIILTTVIAVLLTACRNDIADIRAITDKNTKPVQTSYGASYTFSEKGNKQTRLEAGVLEQYEVEGDDDYILAGGGFSMIFFDSLEREEARIKADSGIYLEKKKTLKAWGNVVLTNVAGEQLETSELIYDQDSAHIHTEKRVKITLAGGSILHGLGIESNDNFTRYRILQPTGDFVVEEKQDTTNGKNQ